MTQPDAYLLLQHRTIVLRIASPAMNEHDTPLPDCVGSGHKLLHSNFGLFHGMAMQVDMRLDRIITTVQALRQTSIDPWGNAFHILIRVLNRKLPAPFNEIPQVSQGFVVVSRIEGLWRQWCGFSTRPRGSLGNGVTPAISARNTALSRCIRTLVDRAGGRRRRGGAAAGGAAAGLSMACNCSRISRNGL